MHRRGPTRVLVSLFAAATLVLAIDSAPVNADSTAAVATSAALTAPDDIPVPTVSDFFPEEANLSDCLGLVEKPGCGSKSRGGWRQTVVLIVIISGLGIVFGNVIRGVRKNRAAIDAESQTTSAARDSTPPSS